MGGLWRAWMGVAAMVGTLGGCGTAAAGVGVSTRQSFEAGQRAFEERRPTLLIENASADEVAIRLNGFRIGTATRGVSCIRLPASTGRIVLELVPMGAAPRRAEAVFLELSPHWRVTIGPSGLARLGEVPMWPSPSRCRPQGKTAGEREAREPS
jgi:hypothetical protein